MGSHPKQPIASHISGIGEPWNLNKLLNEGMGQTESRAIGFHHSKQLAEIKMP
jgi:hypothetical protein